MDIQEKLTALVIMSVVRRSVCVCFIPARCLPKCCCQVHFISPYFTLRLFSTDFTPAMALATFAAAAICSWLSTKPDN